MQSNFSKMIIVWTLLIVFSASFVLPRPVYAIVPVAEPCVPALSWRCTEKTILNPVLTTLAKKVIRALRAATVRWIRTGDFEIKKPFFVTSFIADPQRIADNAARLFLSELTGINFCNYHPSIPSIQALMIPLRFDLSLSCSSIDSGPILSERLDGVLASQHPSQNFSTILNTLHYERERAIKRAISAQAAEIRSNLGFLGQRDPKTGKIMTPGRLIADSLVTADLSEQIGVELVDEFHEALIEIIDTAAGTFIKKGLNL